MRSTALALALVMAAAIPGATMATQPAPEHKIDICHAKPPDTAANGWERLEVDIASSGYQNSGHADQHDKDIIPAYDYPGFTFAGKNWDAAGQAIWRNDCYPTQTQPEPEPKPEPKPEQPQPKVEQPIAQPVVQPAPILAPIQQPGPDRYAPTANIFGPCGDPRVIVTMDNSQSTLPAAFKVAYHHPSKEKRTVKRYTLAPGQVHITGWLWVKGSGHYVRVRDQYQSLLASVRIIRPTPWGQGACPKGLGG